MLLLSRESSRKMAAELVPIDQTLQTKENILKFALLKKFTNAHMINLVVEDKHKQQAIFVTQSNHNNNNYSDNKLIDFVTVFKMVVVAGDKLI